MSDFYELLKERFSCYQLGKSGEFNQEELISKLEQVTELSPSAFNIQGSRVVLVTGEKNLALWELFKQTQESLIPEDVSADYKFMFDNNRQGFGTILFFEDRAAVCTMPTSDSRTEIYKEQSDAMLVMNVWLTLTDLGYGANLQHFNIGFIEEYDSKVKQLLGLPQNWELIAEMPFGSKEEPHNNKEKLPGEEMVFLVK